MLSLRRLGGGVKLLNLVKLSSGNISVNQKQKTNLDLFAIKQKNPSKKEDRKP